MEHEKESAPTNNIRNGNRKIIADTTEIKKVIGAKKTEWMDVPFAQLYYK